VQEQYKCPDQHDCAIAIPPACRSELLMSIDSGDGDVLIFWATTALRRHSMNDERSLTEAVRQIK
jgi:hypothetical protein